MTPVRRARGYLQGTFVVEHGPDQGPVRTTGVVLMPPMGYEDTCAYRPLRVLADALARKGYLVLRLDWPSLGDSAGDPLVVDLVAEGTALAEAAVRSLHDRGIPRVAGIGVRGGGLLALGARGLDDLALLGVPASGKAFLREERAFHQTAARAYGPRPDGAGDPPEGAVEAGGFLYGPRTVAALQAFDPDTHLRGRSLGRVLVIHRDGIAPPPALLSALGPTGAQVTPSPALGLGAMLETSYHSELKPEIEAAVADWLEAGPAGSVTPAPPDLRDRLELEGGPVERCVVLPGQAGELSGILCEPQGGTAPGTAWTLFLNAGGVRRAGPNRLWTRAARELAARGMPSLRFDVRDVGDSDGAITPHPDLEAMYSESAIQDAVQAFDWVQERGAGDIDVVGLCSGAFLGIQLAARRQVRHALLFNGLAFVWNDDARASGVTSHIGASLFDLRRWRRLLKGRINPLGVARAIVSKGLMTVSSALARLVRRPPADEVEILFRTVAGRGTRVRLVSSAGDPSIPYLERHVEPEHRPPLTVLPGVDHTIRPVWAHDRVINLIMEK